MVRFTLDRPIWKRIKEKIRSVGAPRIDEASYSSALIHAFILHFAVDNHVKSTRLNYRFGLTSEPIDYWQNQETL